jgi:hypothetical protein
MSDAPHPCIGCPQTPSNVCREGCEAYGSYHAEQDRQRLYSTADSLMSIWGYTRAETSATNIGKEGA